MARHFGSSEIAVLKGDRRRRSSRKRRSSAWASSSSSARWASPRRCPPASRSSAARPPASRSRCTISTLAGSSGGTWWPRRLHLEDLAGPRRGLERPPRPRLQTALHRRDLGWRQDDRGPVGARPGGRRR